MDSELERVDREIEIIERSIRELKEKRNEFIELRNQLLDKIAQKSVSSAEQVQKASRYDSTGFPWSERLSRLAQQHFNIQSFRPLQLPILNAVLEDRHDLFVVLPTGAGKSLCYQLPAITDDRDGFTLVISPLVSLIKDQVFHLCEAHIPAEYLLGSSTREHVSSVQQSMIPQKNQPRPSPFRLLYVTPEKIAKSKRFMAALNKAYDGGLLRRIVVDEAHCCSQQGHDFRPDYKQLNILRTVFPKTRITALTATCPWSVMKDVMRILNMKQPQVPDGTLVFSAPLYRPNLVYSVIQKPSSADETIQHITQWIQERYPNESGIIYCLSRKDTETVAKMIYKESKGTIRCGTYHADMNDEDKEMIHQKWRLKEIKVMVATIAFGMGINHLQTRFVIHHCISKSIEGYYQESGRAGRDGKRAECVIYHSPLEVYQMVKYAQDYTTCRKVLFESYFALDANEQLVNEISLDESCGVCDNCNRSSEDVVFKDIGIEAKALIVLCDILKELNERITMTKLVQMVQGRGLGLAKSRVMNDPEIEIPIRTLTEYDIERLINFLISKGYLTEDIVFTPYTTITYIVKGPLGNQIITHPTLQFSFLKPNRIMNKKQKK
ncbi:hypothetical protein G6F46_009494 [Rhizopus delemar]|uniref:ATP-dependent DNA helicase n=2 Tax=Rhizopus TaxID=4842 RepID=A0A9P6Z0P3_9FUNG|nr:hypothetical protein G6F55_008396 [Rhizopus delemar]KAG1551952.1 hypothetical protein G6F51_001520 [Rhizopus arrhizus]KAG1493553.1 hypothetical protein G6F54_008491 [Rhizopus delemar]KAG1524911.1 hypothetical protein G6F52_003794 [Rhizopus delemar]KAG1547228.1 hypothetical protein G6F49_010265 [Rhizopus delemar]